MAEKQRFRVSRFTPSVPKLSNFEGAKRYVGKQVLVKETTGNYLIGKVTGVNGQMVHFADVHDLRSSTVHDALNIFNKSGMDRSGATPLAKKMSFSLSGIAHMVLPEDVIHLKDTRR